MSNTSLVSILALLLTPPLAILLMSLIGRPERAALYMVWGFVFFGPCSCFIKLPMMPYMSKDNIAYISVLLAAGIMAPEYIKRGRPGSWPGSMVFVSVFGAILTALSNPDMLVYSGYAATVVIPGLNFKDGAYMGMTNLFNAFIPFLVGFAFVRDAKTMRFMARLLMSMLAIYAVLMLLEIRLSPQLHLWVYGHKAHNDFSQTMRWGGYRPMVFMRHGLAVALVVYNCGLAIIGLSRSGEKPMLFGRALHFSWKQMIAAAAFCLFITKSTAAIIYGVAFFPIALKGKAVFVLRVALVLAVMALSYPVARSYDWVPTRDLVDFMEETLGDERAQSMKYRFGNEDQLMVKVRERLYFGWGEYGRQFFYRYDGRQATIPDGFWIIVLGSRGLFGYTPAFLILLYPVFMAQRRYKYVRKTGDLNLLACLTLAQATSVADLIPNGLFNTYPYFLSGALCALWMVLGDPKNRHTEEDPDDADEQDPEGGAMVPTPGAPPQPGGAPWPGYPYYPPPGPGAGPQPGAPPPPPGWPPQGHQ